MNQIRCPNCEKLLCEAEGNDYRLLLYCRRCKKTWFAQGKENRVIATKEKIKIRAPKSASE